MRYAKVASSEAARIPIGTPNLIPMLEPCSWLVACDDEEEEDDDDDDEELDVDRAVEDTDELAGGSNFSASSSV